MDHHHVPQFYLEKWAGPDGRLWRYRREPPGHVGEKRVVPKGTAFEPDLYAVTRPPLDPHIIETQFLQRIDSEGSRVLPKLIEAGSSSLDDTDRTWWALFMNSMLERNLATIIWRDESAPVAAAQTIANLRAVSGTTPDGRQRVEQIIARIDAVQMARNSVREFMVNAISDGKVIDYLKSLNWVVRTRGPEKSFITTDQPVLVNVGQTELGRRTVVGIHVLSMALSPTTLFFAHPANWGAGEDVEALVGNLLFGHDLLLLHAGCTCVYSSQKIEDGPRVRLRRAVELVLTDQMPTPNAEQGT